MNTPAILGLITIAIAVLSYSLYLRDVLRGHTKPNAVTWLVWALLNGFVFSQQVLGGAGEGAWALGATALANVAIFLVALKFGEISTSRVDKLCLTLSVLILALWAILDSPVIPVVLASITFVLGFIPTFKKSYHHASEETLATYALNASKFALVLFTLQSFTLVTALYPSVLVLLNLSFVAFLLLRRSPRQPARQRVR